MEEEKLLHYEIRVVETRSRVVEVYTSNAYDAIRSAMYIYQNFLKLDEDDIDYVDYFNIGSDDDV